MRSPHGTTKIERLSFGTGTIAAMSLRTFSHGTVMWIPLAGRIECGCVPSSSARTSSENTPAAFTTVFARTVMSRPSACTTAPVTRPLASFVNAVTPQWLASTPPCAAAVRASNSVNRASSAWAS